MQPYRPYATESGFNTVRGPTPPAAVSVGAAPSSHADGLYYNAPIASSVSSASPGGYSDDQNFYNAAAYGGSQLPQQTAGMGSPLGSSDSNGKPLHQTRFGHPDDDLPLLEELGIFPRHILAKAKAVLHPLTPMSPDVVEDTDLAGPVTFAVLLAVLLSFQGKVQFSAIYGHSLIGIAFSKSIFSMMMEPTSQATIPLQFVVSTLGYCLLPTLVLAFFQTFQHWILGSHRVMLPFAIVVVGWSAWCATNMFTKALAMDSQKYLLLYPLIIFYAVFAALTIF